MPPLPKSTSSINFKNNWVTVQMSLSGANDFGDNANVDAIGFATGILTFTGQPADAETVTIDGKIYTFQTVLTDVNGNVLIGALATDSLDNLIAAITLGAGAGATYAASTTIHATVTAAAGAGDTMDTTAKTGGTAGNDLATVTSVTNGAWGATTLTGGTAFPALVSDRGIWKYPQHTTGGRITIPRGVGRPVRLANIVANFGASVTYEVHIAGYDGTASRPDDTSAAVYPAVNAASYREGDVIIDTGTAQHLASNYDPIVAGITATLHPGMSVYIVTSGAASPLARLTFQLGV